MGELTGRGRATEQTRPTQPTRRASSGGVGDLLDQVLGDKAGSGADTLRTGPISLPEPEREEELSAALMLRAVIQAVKCDGDLDDDERQRLMKAMGDARAEPGDPDRGLAYFRRLVQG